MNNSKPDLVIGRQTTIDTWSERSYVNAKILSNLDDIKPHDRRILFTMLLLNKVFKREKILEYKLKMPILTHASDAGFFFSFLYNCEKIVGCPHEILIYKKRIFLDDSSLSQDSNLDSINSYYESYKIILNAFKEYCYNYERKLESDGNYNELNEFKTEALEYIDTLRFKETTVLFLDITYRFFWRSDIDTLKRVKEIIEKMKNELYPPTWLRIVNSNKDLNMNNLITNHEDMSSNPLISVVLNDLMDLSIYGEESKLDKGSLLRILYNIYNAHFPSFELLLPNHLKHVLNEDFTEPNILYIDYESSHDFKNEAINASSGEYIFFIEEDILFSPSLFKKMFDKLNNSEIGWILVPMNPVIDNKFSNKDNYIKSKFSKRNIINSNVKYDFLLSDKLFKKDFLESNNFSFSSNLINDIQTLYELGNYKKFNLDLILTTDNYLKSPFISFIIDDLSTNSDEINNILDSIYKQDFKSFDIILNENLKSKVSNEFFAEENFNILKNEKFKEIAIKKSKAKYAIIVNIPVIYHESTLKELFSKIENDKNDLEEATFVSTPIYQKNDENNDIIHLSSQVLSYFYKNISTPSRKSKFLSLDLYLSNKLINLEYLRKNSVYFDSLSGDMLKIYRGSKSLRVHKKLVSTKLLQKNLFESSFKNKNIPLSTRIFYKFNKLFLIMLSIKYIFKNGGR